jgi:serine phosphatase RsbU (regulator of sigma subunit)
VPELLGEVVRATAGASDSAEVLSRAARVLLRRADWVIADRLDEPDLIVRVAAYDGFGPLALPEGMGSAAARRSAALSVGMLATVLGAPRRLLRLGLADLRALTRSKEPHVVLQAKTALSLGSSDLLLVGLAVRDHLVGVLTLGSRTGFSEQDVGEVADVALHLGLALDAARLRDGQREIATALQTSLLPALPAVPGLRLAARYRPAARGLRVGGDWYDAFRTRSGLVVVIGDASGHDVSAAVRMSDLRNLLRAHAIDHDESPAAAVARMDRTAAALQLDATATCIMSRVVPGADGVWCATWTNAGHLPPIHVRDGRAVLVETEPELMLGVDPSTARTDYRRRLVPGDLLLMYTDGLVEVPGESLDDRLEELRKTVEEHAGAQPDPLVEILLATFGSGVGDDIALLALDVPLPLS